MSREYAFCIFFICAAGGICLIIMSAIIFNDYNYTRSFSQTACRNIKSIHTSHAGAYYQGSAVATCEDRRFNIVNGSYPDIIVELYYPPVNAYIASKSQDDVVNWRTSISGGISSTIICRIQYEDKVGVTDLLSNGDLAIWIIAIIIGIVAVVLCMFYICQICSSLKCPSCTDCLKNCLQGQADDYSTGIRKTPLGPGKSRGMTAEQLRNIGAGISHSQSTGCRGSGSGNNDVSAHKDCEMNCV